MENYGSDYISFILILTRALGLPKSIEIDERPDRKFRQSFMGASAAARGRGRQKQVTGSLASSLSAEQAGPSHGVRVEVRPGVRLEGWLAHLFGGVCRGHAQYSAFALDTLFLLPALQKWQLGFFGSFFNLLSIICPSCACTQLYLVPCSLFVFCCWRRHLSRCKPRRKGPRSQACLSIC